MSLDFLRAEFSRRLIFGAVRVNSALLATGAPTARKRTENYFMSVILCQLVLKKVFLYILFSDVTLWGWQGVKIQ